MKRVVIAASISILMLLCFSASADTGLFFDVTAVGMTLSMTTVTVPPDGVYSNAGIKITSGQQVVNCHRNPPGSRGVYCLFSAKHTPPPAPQITITGSGTSLQYILCLNADDPITCQHYTTGLVSEAKFAYVTNGEEDARIGVGAEFDSVSRCTIDPSGTLSDCGSTGSGFSNPYGIAFYRTNGVTYSYVANDNGTVSRCTVSDTSGALSDCGSTGSGFLAPRYIAFYTTTMGTPTTYAYVTDSGAGMSDVFQCTVEALGALSGCGSTGSGFLGPLGIAFYTTTSGTPTTYAYIANSSVPEVLRCAVNTTTGALSSCGSTGSGFLDPRGIVFHAITSGTPATYAYVTDANNTVFKCTVNTATGTFSDCGSTGSGFSDPYGIAVLIKNSVPYIYVTGRNSSNVSFCTVDASTGALTNCNPASSDFFSPRGIAFN